MKNGNEIMKITGITYRQLCFLVHEDVLVPVVKRNTPRTDLFDEKDVEVLVSDKERFRNNVLALEIERELLM